MSTPAPFMDALRPALRGSRHMSVAGHYLAAEAAFQIMEAGGNAVDAGVAAGLVLGVVKSDLVNIAGVAPILIYAAEQDEVVSIAGLGHWPQATDPALFARHHADGVPPGVLRQLVPAAPDAWITALAGYGSMSFAEVATAAIRFARDGFVMYPLMASIVAAKADSYARWPASAAIYLPGGHPPEVGELFVQADLAGSLQYMADQERAAGGSRTDGLAAARAAFYQGDIARAIAGYHAEQGGLLTLADLAAYRSPVGAALSTEFNGSEVFSCGPWCQGPMLLQILNLLRGTDLRALGHNSPAYIHRLTEAVKLAAADRERWYGDPEHVAVPIYRLLSEAYAAERRALISDDKAWAGMPPPGGDDSWTAPAARPLASEALDTSYVCTVDGRGNVFSATPSDGSFDGPVVPGTGLVPSTRGSQSRPDPDHPASIAPGKRPRLTPTPGLARHGGDWIMPFGTPGGDVQCQAMAQTFLNVTAFGMNPQAAVEAPRFASFSFPNSFAPHAYHPGQLKLEARIPEQTAEALARLGHEVEWWADWQWQAGAICMVQAERASGIATAGADPRRPCYAVGW